MILQHLKKVFLCQEHLKSPLNQNKSKQFDRIWDKSEMENRDCPEKNIWWSYFIVLLSYNWDFSVFLRENVFKDIDFPQSYDSSKLSRSDRLITVLYVPKNAIELNGDALILYRRNGGSLSSRQRSLLEVIERATSNNFLMVLPHRRMSVVSSVLSSFTREQSSRVVCPEARFDFRDTSREQNFAFRNRRPSPAENKPPAADKARKLAFPRVLFLTISYYVFRMCDENCTRVSIPTQNLHRDDIFSRVSPRIKLAPFSRA